MGSFDENHNRIVRNVIMPGYNTDPGKCWQINFHKSNTKKNAKWVLKTNDSASVYSVKISILCDVKDAEQWTKYTSVNFAIELLANFKKGHNEFNRWINERKK